MKNCHKIILVKGSISASAILCLACVIVNIIAELNNSDFLLNITLLLFILSCISGTVMILLMTRLKIKPERVKSEKYEIKNIDYKNFKNDICLKLKEDGYKEIRTYTNELYNIEYLIKRKMDSTYIYAFIKLDELTDEIYLEYKENYFEKFGNYLLETNQLKVTNNFHITFIISVDKITKQFNSYTERTVRQYWGRFSLPIGITSKTIYIGTQKDGPGIGRYKKMKKQFKNYIADMIESTDK